jgi:hypothetical protein
MINCVAPLTTPEVAVIAGLPIPTAEASPELLTLATVLSGEVHATEAVKSAVLPSLKLPVAFNC